MIILAKKARGQNVHHPLSPHILQDRVASMKKKHKNPPFPLDRKLGGGGDKNIRPLNSCQRQTRLFILKGFIEQEPIKISVPSHFQRWKRSFPTTRNLWWICQGRLPSWIDRWRSTSRTSKRSPGTTGRALNNPTVEVTRSRSKGNLKGPIKTQQSHSQSTVKQVMNKSLGYWCPSLFQWKIWRI